MITLWRIGHLPDEFNKNHPHGYAYKGDWRRPRRVTCDVPEGTDLRKWPRPYDSDGVKVLLGARHHLDEETAWNKLLENSKNWLRWNKEELPPIRKELARMVGKVKKAETWLGRVKAARRVDSEP